MGFRSLRGRRGMRERRAGFRSYLLRVFTHPTVRINRLDSQSGDAGTMLRSRVSIGDRLLTCAALLALRLKTAYLRARLCLTCAALRDSEDRLLTCAALFDVRGSDRAPTVREG